MRADVASKRAPAPAKAVKLPADFIPISSPGIRRKVRHGLRQSDDRQQETDMKKLIIAIGLTLAFAAPALAQTFPNEYCHSCQN
jgi:hypothetical protein